MTFLGVKIDSPQRMTLSSVQRGRIEKPMRVLLYGPEKLGKTTFAAGAPSPIFLATEDGTTQVDVERFPRPGSWFDVVDALKALTNEKHEYKTLVIDTVDWLEPLIWAQVCAEHKDTPKSIDDIGFGRGYESALVVWRALLFELEVLWKRGMHIVLLAHSWIKPFKDPESDGFDRYELKLHKKAAALLKEWCDAVLFGQYEVAAYKDEKTKRVRGIGTGVRVLRTQHTAAYDAGNRYSLPDSLPLSWEDFAAAVKARAPADPEQLRVSITEAITKATAEDATKAKAALERAGNDAVKLAQLNNWITARATLSDKKE